MFAAIVLAFSLIIGRPLAWKLCRSVLYPMHSHALAAIACILWGLVLAIGLRLLIIEYQPHWAIKYFLGYGAFSYLAFINYGLFQESTIPREAQTRHVIIETVPFATFVLASIAAAWLMK